MPAGLLGLAFPQRSPPWLLTTAACGGLRSTPDCRSRRALLHLSYSCIPPFGPAIFVTQDPTATSPAFRVAVAKRLCSIGCLAPRVNQTRGKVRARCRRLTEDRSLI